MSALESGMDIVFVLKTEYLQDVIATQLRAADPFCITIPTTFNGFNVTRLDGNQYENFVPVFDSMRLEDNPMGGVDLLISLRSTYGLINTGSDFRPFGPGETVELPLTVNAVLVDDEPTLTFSMVMDVGLRGDRSIEMDVLDILDLNFENQTIPIEDLERTKEVIDTIEEDGMVIERTKSVTVLRPVPTEVAIKRTEVGLCVGISVRYERDDLTEVADQVEVFCSLPEAQPADLEQFEQFELTPADLPNRFSLHDWMLAISPQLLNAIIEVETGRRQGTLFLSCLSITQMRERAIDVTGSGSVNIRGDWAGIGIDLDVPFQLTAELFIEKVYGEPRLVGEYTVSNVDITGALGGIADIAGIDPMSIIEAKSRDGSIDFDFPTGSIAFDFPMSFGERDSPVGQMTLNQVAHRSTALLIGGRGSISHPRPRTLPRVPAELLFGRPCNEGSEQSVREFEIWAQGLKICPAIIRDLDEPDESNFSIEAPSELQPGGNGLPIADRPLTVSVALEGEVDQNYRAVLDLPTDAGVLTVRLEADLRRSGIELTSTHVDFDQVVYVACDSTDPVQRVLRRIPVRNTGQGTLQPCDVTLIDNPSNDNGQPTFIIGAIPGGIPAGEERDIIVVAQPSNGDIGRTLSGVLRIEHNAGTPIDVTLSAHVERSQRIDADGVSGGLSSQLDPALVDLICLNVDWDFIRRLDEHLLLDIEHFGEVTELLGGFECCPPPSSPACQCLDFAVFELDPETAPAGLVLDRDDIELKEVLHSTERILVAPFQPDGEYQLRVEMGDSSVGEGQLQMRRWVARQSGLYEADETITDFAVIGESAFLASQEALEIISLADPAAPEQIAHLSEFEDADYLVVIDDQHLGVGTETMLTVLDVTTPTEPTISAEYGTEDFGSRIVTGRSKAPVGFGVRDEDFRVITFVEPHNPVIYDTVPVPHAVADLVASPSTVLAYGDGQATFYFSDNGYDFEAVGTIEIPFETRHVLTVGETNIFVGESSELALVKLDETMTPVRSASGAIEPWLSPFIPTTGQVHGTNGYSYLLTADGTGLRSMKLHSNFADSMAD